MAWLVVIHYLKYFQDPKAHADHENKWEKVQQLSYLRDLLSLIIREELQSIRGEANQEENQELF